VLTADVWWPRRNNAALGFSTTLGARASSARLARCVLGALWTSPCPSPPPPRPRSAAQLPPPTPTCHFLLPHGRAHKEIGHTDSVLCAHAGPCTIQPFRPPLRPRTLCATSSVSHAVQPPRGADARVRDMFWLGPARVRDMRPIRGIGGGAGGAAAGVPPVRCFVLGTSYRLQQTYIPYFCEDAKPALRRAVGRRCVPLRLLRPRKHACTPLARPRTAAPLVLANLHSPRTCARLWSRVCACADEARGVARVRVCAATAGVRARVGSLGEAGRA
jgi:hypothetical protein